METADARFLRNGGKFVKAWKRRKDEAVEIRIDCSIDSLIIISIIICTIFGSNQSSMMIFINFVFEKIAFGVILSDCLH